MKRKLITLLISLGIIGTLSGCGGSQASSNTAVNTAAESSGAAEATNNTEPTTDTGTVKLLGLADLVPHNEIIEFVKPVLAKQGIEIEIVSTAADATWLDKLDAGEVDFHYDAHEPYLNEYNELNGTSLVSVGAIHVEPIAAYSNYYEDVSEVPDDAKFIVPNDPTNEYRALKIIEKAGFIKLDPNLPELKASIEDIVEYIKPIEIVEIDSIQIVGLAQDFDVYITNTNKALEAGIDTSKYLFREDEDSPYANVIIVKEDRTDDPAIKALVEALRSDETRQFIEEKYNGAVIPAK